MLPRGRRREARVKLSKFSFHSIFSGWNEQKIRDRLRMLDLRQLTTWRKQPQERENIPD
jgi:hypothetical protein